MSVSLAELCQDQDLSPRTAHIDMPYVGHVRHVLGRIGALGQLSTGDSLLATLESLSEYDQTRECAAALLGGLPANALLSHFGEKVMAWTAVNDRHWPQRGGGFRAEIDEEGYDSELLARAVTLAWGIRRPPRVMDVLTQFAVMESTVNINELIADWPELLVESAHPGVTLSERRLADYGILPFRVDFNEHTRNETQGRVRNWPGREDFEIIAPEKEAVAEGERRLGKYYGIWLDTPVGFALTHKGIPQAFLSVSSNDGQKLVIEQLQRVQAKIYDADLDNMIVDYKMPRGLMPLDWQKLLVRSAAILAGRLDMKTLALQTCNNILARTYHGKPSCHLERDQAIWAYDETAYRLGFTRGDDGIWNIPPAAAALGQFSQNSSESVLQRPRPVKFIAIEPWTRIAYTKAEVGHEIDSIDNAFRVLGENESPLSSSIAAAHANGSVRILDMGCGNCLSIAGLKEKVLASTGLRKKEVVVVGIDGLNHIDGLENSEFDRIDESDVDLRVAHLAHATLEPSYYDVAYSFDTLRFNEDPAAIINNVLSSLTLGGAFYCDILQSQAVRISEFTDRLLDAGWGVKTQALEVGGRIVYKFTKPNTAS